MAKTITGTYGGTAASPIKMNVYSDGTVSPAGYGDYVAPTTGAVAPTGTSSSYSSVYSSTGSTPTTTPAPTPTGTVQPGVYGKTENQVAEGNALDQVGYIEKAAGSSGLVSSTFIKNNIANRPDLIAFYVHAIEYGDYTIGDVLNDMKRLELVSQGNTAAKNLKIIDATLPRASYQATAEGQRSVTDASKIIPTFNLQGLTNPEILNYGKNMPDDLFKMMVPVLDRNSQEFKDAVADVKSAYFDFANQKLQAGTEQAKAVADYNYQRFKEQINRDYGILLSDDADKAWKQLEDLENSFNTRGIAGSGMQNEAIDDMLKQTRKQDMRYRQEKLTKEENEMAAQFTASATPAQIKKLIDEDIANGITDPTQQRAYKWGLVPSAEILELYSMDNLKKRYPEKTEEELQAYRDALLDENGNYRSTLYAKYYDDLNKNKIAELTAAKDKVYQEALDAEEKSKAAYDTTDPFYIAGGQGTGITGGESIPAAGATGTPTGGVSDAQFIETMKAAGINITQDQLNTARASGALGTPTGTQQPAGAGSTPTGITPKKTTAPAVVPTTGASGQSFDLSKFKDQVIYQTPGTGTKATGVDLTKFKDQVISQTPGTGTNTNGINWPTLKTGMNTTTPSTATKVTVPKATVTPAPIVKPAVVAPKTGYQGGSISDYLSSTGGDSSYANRSKIAAQQGITGYSGTAEQNTALLKKLRGY